VSHQAALFQRPWIVHSGALFATNGGDNQIERFRLKARA
jgi:hypothetical protein